MISSADTSPAPDSPTPAAAEQTAASSEPAKSKSAKQSQAATLPVFMIVQLVLTAAVFGYGTHRFQQMEEERIAPEPQNDPVRVVPLHDNPNVVSDEQLVSVLNRLRPEFRGPEPKINFVDHALRFWGVEAAFDDEDSLSGVELRELLTDHRRFTDAWGDETRPFLLPRTDTEVPHLGFRTKDGPSTASHYDHTLAGLAEVGTPLDYPVNTIRGELPLRAAFDFTRDVFSLNQDEYEWSVMVFLHYMPHVRTWYTKEGQLITWDILADRLMRQRLARGVCYGNHRLYTLATMLQVDAEFELLTDEGRSRVVAYLKDVSDRLAATQSEEGYWDGRWPGEEWDGPQPARVEGPLGMQADRLLATGHALEWWAIAPVEVLPAEEVTVKAGQWLVSEIDSLTDSEIRRYYTFLSHAGRALALWRGQFPAETTLPAGSQEPVEENKELVEKNENQ
ncbi:MAG: hypothetical protein ACYTGL_10195 [Planctomycetota bacterium]|jgi:hypothetical protein